MVVNRTLSRIWFSTTIRPINFQVGNPWDEITGDYPTNDGWIRIHANASDHKRAVLLVLGIENHFESISRERVAQRVLDWNGETLENAIVNTGGCAAEMRTLRNWKQHIQGIAQIQATLVDRNRAVVPFQFNSWRPTISKSLNGLRILDLTRVLAGPVCTRILASAGADVSRIDPSTWIKPVAEVEVNVGKRCAILNLNTSKDCLRFQDLLSEADVFVHGLRPGALDRLGITNDFIQSTRRGVTNVSLSSFSASTPWEFRRGFDSLVQMSTGIASYAMQVTHSNRPVPLPVQALNHATGYLMATEVILGLCAQLQHSQTTTSRLCLAGTAELLLNHPLDAMTGNLNPNETNWQ